MRLKSYCAGTVEAAIALAARELGENAMLVYSREASPEARYLGRYEVVFGLPEEPGTMQQEPAVTPPLPKNAPANPKLESAKPAQPLPFPGTAVDPIRDEMQALREQLEKLAAKMNQSVAPAVIRPAVTERLPVGGRSEFAKRFEAALCAADFPPSLVSEILWGIAETGDGLNLESQLAALHKVLARTVGTDSQLGNGEECHVVAIVGPPGVGKTTALVQLAARYGVAGRRPAQLINFDNCRIAGAEQLRTFAAILGIGFQGCETAGAVLQALEEHRHKELVLIDTPGIGIREDSEAEELIRLFRSNRSIDVHLALSASMKPADLTRVADRFAAFRPNKLLFTRLDETSTFGSLWAEAATRSLPISFLCEGQRIPEDFREATGDYLADLVMGSSFAEWEPLEMKNTDSEMPGGSASIRDGSAAVAA
jgi:flagellar biosynthesis protein FlhF